MDRPNTYTQNVFSNEIGGKMTPYTLRLLHSIETKSKTENCM